MKANRNKLPTLTAMGAALLAAFSPALAQSDEVAELTKPTSELGLGIGYVSKDNQRFGQYNGLNEKGGYGLIDLDYVRRDDATGRWTRFSGRNVGLDHRELRFENERQGDWGYFIDFSQTPRFDPFTVTTRLTGIGSNTQTVGGSATAQQVRLKTERDALTLGFDKAINRDVSVEVRFRNEEKDGARLWGQGTFGTLNFLTDPIDQTTRQLDATVKYTTERLQLSGGYYGTSFENRNSVLNVGGAAIAGFNQMALPPDNQSHQVHLAGGYNFSKTTRGTFKVAYGRITQDEAFPVAPVAGAPGNLDGRIDTTLVQAGLTARPMPRLSVRADLRYENRDDKTPVFLYFPAQATATATNNGENEPRSIKTTSGKLEASYRLPMGFRLTGGVDYVEKKRNAAPVRSVGFREKTDETSVRAELRRSISETVTGAVSYVHSERGGSDFLFNNRNTTPGGSNQVAPLHLADRDRDMVRFTVNWMPTDPLSLNFRFDEARDKYKGRGISVVDQNVRKGEAQNYSVDAGYTFSERVQGNAWFSRNDNKLDAQTCRIPGSFVCTPGPDQVWGANLRNVADSYGLGVRAKVTSKLEIMADFAETDVRDEMLLVSIAGAPAGTLDNINTKVTTFKLEAKYALQRNSGIRVMYIHDRFRTDDWAWSRWNYSPGTDGGTTILQQPDQKVDFLGVAFYYRWQ